MAGGHGTDSRGGLSLGTLVIAIAAATAAALITSRLWARGAVLSTALTPLIVAIVSELLRRPADRVSQLRASRQASKADAAAPGGERPDEGMVTPAQPTREPVHVYGRGRVHLKLVLATGAIAFAIAAAALTLPELIFGGAVATNQQTTLFGGGTNKQPKPQGVGQQHPTAPQLTTTKSRTTTTKPRTTTTTRGARTTTPRTGTTTPRTPPSSSARNKPTKTAPVPTP